MKVVMLMMAPEDAHGDRAPKEAVQAISGYAMDLASKGIVTVGQQLPGGIGEVFGVEQNGDVGRVVDGPYAEIKELFGGYLEMKVGSMDEARELAAKCPHLRIGPILVMPVVPRGCRTFRSDLRHPPGAQRVEPHGGNLPAHSGRPRPSAGNRPRGAACRFPNLAGGWHPGNTGAWLATVARRRALNQLRSRTRRGEVALPGDLPGSGDGDPPLAEDDRLALLLLCCHPSLSHDTKVTLTLRLAGGLSTREIAGGFIADEQTIGQRISRAKRHLRSTQDPLREPAPEDMGPRIEAVLEVVYLIFNEGYLSDTDEGDPRRIDVGDGDAGGPATQLAPDMPEVWGLAALIHLKSVLTVSRLPHAGQLIPIDEQDRRLWDRKAIRRGERCRSSAIGAARRGLPVGAYVLQVEI